MNTGEIKNHTKNKSYGAQPLPDFMKDLVEAGGLMNYVKDKLRDRYP